MAIVPRNGTSDWRIPNAVDNRPQNYQSGQAVSGAFGIDGRSLSRLGDSVGRFGVALNARERAINDQENERVQVDLIKDIQDLQLNADEWTRSYQNNRQGQDAINAGSDTEIYFDEQLGMLRDKYSNNEVALRALQAKGGSLKVATVSAMRGYGDKQESAFQDSVFAGDRATFESVASDWRSTPEQINTALQVFGAQWENDLRRKGLDPTTARVELEKIYREAEAARALGGLVASVNSGDLENAERILNGAAAGNPANFSAEYESGTAGSNAIGYDKNGGTSYGKFQISSNAGTFDSWIKWLDKNGHQNVAGILKEGGPANTGSRSGKMPAIWSGLVKDGLITDEMQQAFIEDTHYNPALEKLSPELQEAVRRDADLNRALFSTAVQHGSGAAADMFQKNWDKSEGNADAFLDALYASRAKKFGSSPEEIQASVQNRLMRERAGLGVGLLTPKQIQYGKNMIAGARKGQLQLQMEMDPFSITSVDIQEDKFLDAADKAVLLRSLRSYRKDDSEAQEIISRLRRGEAVTISNEIQKSAAARAHAEEMQEAIEYADFETTDTEDQTEIDARRQAAVEQRNNEWIAKTGHVEAREFDNIKALALSADVSQRTEGLNRLVEISTLSTTAFKSFPEAIQNKAISYQNMVAAGVNPEVATQYQVEGDRPEMAAQRQALLKSETFTAFKKTVTPEKIKAELAAQRLGRSEAEAAAITNRVSNALPEFFVMCGGDSDVALKAAIESVGQYVGPSKFGFGRHDQQTLRWLQSRVDQLQAENPALDIEQAEEAARDELPARFGEDRFLEPDFFSNIRRYGSFGLSIPGSFEEATIMNPVEKIYPPVAGSGSDGHEYIDRQARAAISAASVRVGGDPWEPEDVYIVPTPLTEQERSSGNTRPGYALFYKDKAGVLREFSVPFRPDRDAEIARIDSINDFKRRRSLREQFMRENDTIIYPTDEELEEWSLTKAREQFWIPLRVSRESFENDVLYDAEIARNARRNLRRETETGAATARRLYREDQRRRADDAYSRTIRIR